jgi:hypothetical protein
MSHLEDPAYSSRAYPVVASLSEAKNITAVCATDRAHSPIYECVIPTTARFLERGEGSGVERTYCYLPHVVVAAKSNLPLPKIGIACLICDHHHQQHAV